MTHFVKERKEIGCSPAPIPPPDKAHFRCQKLKNDGKKRRRGKDEFLLWFYKL